MITIGSLVLQLRLMPFNEWQLIEDKKKKMPDRINLGSIGEDSTLEGNDLQNTNSHRIKPCSRPPLPTREEMLEGEWRPWKWFGMTRTEPPFQLFGKILKRWLHCFTYPMSLNSLEVIGLTVQLVVIVNALYFGFGAEQQGDCTLDGFAPEEVGFHQVNSEEACLELTAASGSSGLWTKTKAEGTPKNIGILTLALPSLFVLTALIMITVNTRAYLKQRQAEQKAKRALEAQQRFKSAGAGVRNALGAISGFKTFNKNGPGDFEGRPSSALVNKPGEMTAAEKVNTWDALGQGNMRRNSTPTGEPKNMSIETIDLLCAYDLSPQVKQEYLDEVNQLLGNKGAKGAASAGKITQMQLGKGKGIEQLLPVDQKRLLFLQWRLAEDRVIRQARAALEEERFGVEIEQVEPEEVLQNGVKKMIFVLKFISKTYGPMARNKLMFEKEMRDAQRRTRRAKKKFQSAAKLVQLASAGPPGGLASIAKVAHAAADGSPRPLPTAWGLDVEKGRTGTGNGNEEENSKDARRDRKSSAASSSKRASGEGDERRKSSKSSKSSSDKDKARKPKRSKSKRSENDGGDFAEVLPGGMHP